MSEFLYDKASQQYLNQTALKLSLAKTLANINNN